LRRFSPHYPRGEGNQRAIHTTDRPLFTTGGKQITTKITTMATIVKFIQEDA